jgi:peptidoglycan/LPS O-acetylase OafA/YrhL
VSGDVASSARHPGDDLRFLDGLRGLAALVVMVGHARWVLWEGFSAGYAKHPGEYSLGGKLLVYAFSFFRFGHEAVIFFFVLSGFVIHLRYARKLAQSPGANFDWGPFVWRRARRLYPPLLLAMALTLACDAAGAAAGFGFYRSDPAFPLTGALPAPRHDALTALGNLLFVMDTYVPSWGSDQPLWSLKFEWWFYMIYPAFFLLARRSLAGATAAVAGLFALSFFPALWPLLLLRQVFSAMICWWLGALLAEAYAGRLPRRFGGIALAALLLPALPFVSFGSETLRDLTWAIGFAGLIAAGFFLQARGVSLRAVAALKPLGDMSYTLYVTHLPLLLLLSGAAFASGGGALPRHFGFAAAGIALCLALAYAGHFVVERPFVGRKPGTKAGTKARAVSA